ncbi:hypothetical protein SAMN05421821_104279 [Mucilaginibacter lappiensis]|uniref:Uncharacterized protein n=1 Tax=Mucilaginibacter lappiensis TaxID=354630 RepID=A0ABR6PHR4_9SPHI|nr:hypothetical protein [Mucilaginibacter lappiensis]SIR00726.1 hypothetical protein SAMN05421821_104279 [Mucilaginibacter lappiensis]
MNVEVFKTNVNTRRYADKLVNQIHKAFHIITLTLIWTIAIKYCVLSAIKVLLDPKNLSFF